MDTYAALKESFAKVFGPGGRVHVVRSPGRVNLIGEHTDYNDGFVMPMAIEPQVTLICRARTDGKIRLASESFSDTIAEFDVNAPITRGQPKWANYSKGVAHFLKAAGIPLIGMEALIANTLPVGGGLSSSAALEVGTGRALLGLAGEQIDVDRLALICQKAEHEFALVPCGIMDQMIVAAGKKDHALLLDCRDLSKRFTPINGQDLRVVIVNSMVKHELSGGEYAERRHQCETAAAHFARLKPGVKALRDVTSEDVSAARAQLDDVVFRRARHVVGENQRCTDFAALLSSEQYEDAGKLMVASHNSLRDDYEVSTPELDYLVEQSMTVKGVYGARMTGGGFGGCIVALAQPRSVEPLRAHLENVYPKKFNVSPQIIVTTATDGAAMVE